MRLACVAAALALPCGAAAQDWATLDVCTVATPEVNAEAFAPARFAEIEARAKEIPNGTGRFWQAIAPDGGVFMAVGAFHLPGTGGLVSGLRERGYEDRRLPLAGEVSE